MGRVLPSDEGTFFANIMYVAKHGRGSGRRPMLPNKRRKKYDFRFYLMIAVCKETCAT